MNKDEYREEVLEELREIKLNTEVAGLFSILVSALLFVLTIIVLFK